MDDRKEKVEEIIQKMINLLEERPEGYSAGQLCAAALNRMLVDRGGWMTCQIQFLRSVENETPYGI